MTEENEIQKPKKAKKNGEIEFLRFVFCMAVLLFHCQKYVIGEPDCGKGYHISLFCHGAMGVEFFFLVSGVLMAKSAYRKKTEGCTQPLAEDAFQFLKHKYLSIFPMHAMAFILAFFSYTLSGHMNWLKTVASAIESIPALFLVQMTGMGILSPNHITWYLSCMFIAMALLYPLCRKYYDMFTHYIAPVTAILLLGFCMKTTGRLTGVQKWTGICYKSVFRAVIEISLGAAAFEIARMLSEKKLTKAAKIWITITEIVLFVCSMVYCIGTFPYKWEEVELFAILLLVIIAFSGQSCGTGLFDHAVFYYLGRLSLPLYLAQVSSINIVTGFFKKWPAYRQILVIVAATFVTAWLLLWIDIKIRGILKSRKKLRQKGMEAL